MARVIVAEDENNIRSFVLEALELDGHEAHGVSNGEEAIASLQEQTFDILITDIRMPKVGGLDLIAFVREHQPRVQFIVMTAFGNVQTAVSAMKLGALDYLQKPLRMSELRALVKRAETRLTLEYGAPPSTLVDMNDMGPALTWGDPAMENVLMAMQRVAPTQASVLLHGESGVGKDMFARAIHKLSQRHDRPFLAINCAAISETLSESELFGHERGAFTGANEARAGLIEEANGGTLFLDELGSLQPGLQAKLLRVLESGTYRRVGSSTVRQADVRWLAATNDNLRHMVEIGSFRKDLYHRLAVFPLVIPPLRRRRRDIAPLAEILLGSIATGMGKPSLALSEDALTWLSRQEWPGNVRELRNTIERAAIMSQTDLITPQDVQAADEIAGLSHTSNTTTASGDQELLDLSLFELEKRALIHALELHDGNRKAAAEHLGIPVRSIYNKIKRFELEE